MDPSPSRAATRSEAKEFAPTDVTGAQECDDVTVRVWIEGSRMPIVPNEAVFGCGSDRGEVL